ncbi:hypothetical protein FHW36_104148 [Chitinophaga polysaccharea]|uniref:Uncharacterized protein n=1 Tax=Chitinophaga polysaccharea TaxID=1293035 RepID=A0A561PQR4_9BACT|nr:hypothetical protein FHW36_104148 [Chitinophaga polysaccharea]
MEYRKLGNTSLQPAITVVLAGARNADQAIANAKAMEIA